MASDLWKQRIEASGIIAIRDCPEMKRIEARAPRFLFLRHGETDGNLKRIYQTFEVSLNDTGRAQAVFAAGVLHGAGVRRIVASDMQRAWETACIVGERVGAAPKKHAGFRERWFGDWIGTSSANLNWTQHPPNGESMGEFVTRTHAAFEEALTDEDDQLTLVVGHGGTLYVLAFGLGIDLHPDMVQNATPLAFTRGAQGWRVDALGQAGLQPLRHLNMGW